ncbi:MAG: beta-ketoacyl synthase N-terminal-like domain-containing protein, partial [Neisseria sp.]|nr:beta-ketoacyl synthase N-terminal-like domain-containing protein [Neisseria sp.]
MKRVVVTGIGIVSSLGNNVREVLESLKNLKSGIAFEPVYQEMGMRSHVAGNIKIDPKEHIDRKILRFMGNAAAYAYIAMKEAIENAGLTPEQVSHIRTGIVAGSGGASSSAQVEAADTLRESGI